MGITMNMDGVEAQQGGGPLPDGDYIVRIDKAVEIAGRTNGTPGIECTMVVLVGDHKDRLVWDTMWITTKALGMVRHRLESAGVPIPHGEFVLEAQQLVGRRVQVTVRTEKYEAKDGSQKDRNVVKGWKPAPGSSGNDPLAAPVGNDIPTPAPAAAVSDDDIPF